MVLNVVDAVAVVGAVVIIGVNDVMVVLCCHHCCVFLGLYPYCLAPRNHENKKSNSKLLDVLVVDVVVNCLWS